MCGYYRCMTKPPLCAVLFDFDGTLGYYLPTHLELYVQAAATHGIAVTTEALASAVDAAWGPWETVYGVDHSAHSGDEASYLAIRALLHRGRFEAAGVRTDDATMQAMTAFLCISEQEPIHFALYDDAIPALERVRAAGTPAYIVSNHIWRLPEVSEALGLSQYLAATLTSARVGYRKPHPKIFEAAIAVARGEATSMLYVGDNPTHDVLGARAAGMRAVLIDRRGSSGDATVIRSLMEVPLW